MAIKFYLRDLQHEIHCNTNSTITEVAGAFDLGTMVLEWNECKYALFPNTPFLIKETETNEIWSFIITQDNVEVVKKTNTVKYLHTLTLSQSVHKLNNVPLRNSVFSQKMKKMQNKYKKPVFFSVPVHYDTISPYDFDYIGPLHTDHQFNTATFNKNNYLIDLSNASIIGGAIIKLSSVMSYFQSVTAQGDEPRYYMCKNEQKKWLNDKITRVSVDIIDATDSTSIGHTWYNGIYTPWVLDETERNWLRNRKVFIQIGNGYVDNALQSDLPAQRNAPSGVAPYLAGVITAELILEGHGGHSLYDVLDQLNEQCKKQYNGSSYDNYFTLPNRASGQGLELDSIVAPDFSFTNCDLYEAVAQVMAFIDAFPVLDENGVLGFQYLNNLSDETIDDLVMNDVKTTLNEENFTNKLATYYQNGKLNNPITYPRKRTFKTATTSKFGIPDKNDWYWQVEKSIDYIEELLVLFLSSYTIAQTPLLTFDSEFPHSVQYGEFRLSAIDSALDAPLYADISKFVFPNEIYGYLPSGYANDGTQNKYNSLRYDRRSNLIYLGETGDILEHGTQKDILQYVLEKGLSFTYGFGLYNFLGFGYDDILQRGQKSYFKFNCTYYPILDGKVAQESTANKVDKETIVAEGNGSVDLNRLGKNLQGLVARLGNDEKSVCLPITELKSKIKLGTKFVDELGNNWFANRIQTTFTTSEEKVIVNATFSKNYNALAQFTRLNQEKRFYEINTELTTKGYETINEYVYFTNQSSEDIYDLATQVAIRRETLASIIEKTLIGSSSLVATYDTGLDTVGLYTHGSTEVSTYLTPIVYGCGNQICIEIGCDNDVALTNRTDDDEKCTKAWLYVDENAIANSVDVQGKFAVAGQWNTTTKYPEIVGGVMPGVVCLSIKDFYYYKRPNEIFHLNYALNFLPYWTSFVDALGTTQYKYEEIYFGEKFINENDIIPNTTYSNGKERKLYLYVSNEKYSIIDKKATGEIYDENVTIRYLSSNIEVDDNGAAIYGEIECLLNNTFSIDVSQYASWCLADENRNIYIAVNVDTEINQYASLRFFTRKTRLV